MQFAMNKPDKITDLYEINWNLLFLRDIFSLESAIEFPSI